MDNKKVEVSIKKQVDTITLIFDFNGEKISTADSETVKIIEKETILYRNKVKELLNIELYLKCLYDV